MPEESEKFQIGQIVFYLDKVVDYNDPFRVWAYRICEAKILELEFCRFDADGFKYRIESPENPSYSYLYQRDSHLDRDSAMRKMEQYIKSDLKSLYRHRDRSKTMNFYSDFVFYQIRINNLLRCLDQHNLSQ